MNGSNPIRPPSESAAAILRGTQNGLEILIGTDAAPDEVSDVLTARLDQHPGFFAGSDVTVRCDGALPQGMLGRLEAIAARYELRIAEVGRPVEIRVPRRPMRAVEAPLDVREAPEIAPADLVPSRPLSHDDTADFDDLDLPDSAATFAAAPSLGARLIAGPIRSGCLVESDGHLVVLGDVNPGAELRARGSVIVLGSLRGIAHATCDGEVPGFIIALRLAPQQLRIGDLIARTGDGGAPSGPEIAYAADGGIVVELYRGKLPSGIIVADL